MNLDYLTNEEIKEMLQRHGSDCVIWTMFQNANDTTFYQVEYCQKNCCLRCIRGQDYKRVELTKDEEINEVLLRG